MIPSQTASGSCTFSFVYRKDYFVNCSFVVHIVEVRSPLFHCHILLTFYVLFLRRKCIFCNFVRFIVALWRSFANIIFAAVQCCCYAVHCLSSELLLQLFYGTLGFLGVRYYVNYVMSSQIRLSVCLSSVTLLHHTQRIEFFGSILHHLIA